MNPSLRPLAIAALFAWAGCSCETKVSDLQFSCATSDDCAAGYFCIEGVCSATAPVTDPLDVDAGEEPDAGHKGCGQGDVELCDDGVDNDCDGLADCLDALCEGMMCGANGRTCASQACLCVSDGGLEQRTEASCDDGRDDDCDGLVDCAESSCDGQTCGQHGRVCAGTSCVCTGNGGAPQTAESLCADARDNDCDGLLDCADPDCAGATCGANGRTCANELCACGAMDAGASQPETQCADGADNDCDGTADCADADCGGKACGLNGRACSGTSCVCTGNGGNAQTSETMCSDGDDNDCDGLVDCADSSCGGRSCGSNGKTCSGGACSCSGNGGPVQTSESSCNDGADNDCDGQTDCADSACAGMVCGLNGRTCSGTSCSCTGNGGTAQTAESLCADGKDNDCDGVIDCADPGCSTLSCGANGRTCSGGACGCSGNGGNAQTSETQCSDGADNDCDGTTDCADSSCLSRSCGSNGLVCAGTSCVCGGNGGTVQTAETLCTDGSDNDCDGQTDCGDPGCAGATCGLNGLVCSSGACRCSGNGGAAQTTETSCGDGSDNDCDGQIDCADSTCGGQSCGAGCICAGLRATETACSDSQDNDSDTRVDCNDADCCAGCPANCEASCGDGIDNDGDSLIDCADPHCDGRGCAGDGGVCSSGACSCGGNGGVPEVAESACTDGFDNDCDGKVDCADPDCIAKPCTCEVNCADGIDNDCDGNTDCADTKCLRKACSQNQAGAVCCGTGASSVMCKDLASDEQNCGACGLTCTNGKFCTSVTGGGLVSGHCTCTKSDQCPGGQSCSAASGYCTCATAAQCAISSSCTAEQGLFTPGFCHY